MGPQQAAEGVVFGARTHMNKTSVVYWESALLVGWTAVMTQLMIASLEGMTFNLFTPKISLWRIIRILLRVNRIENALKFGP